MTDHATYRQAGLMAPAAASRVRTGATGLAAAIAPCAGISAWSQDKTTKPATRMFVNVLDHPSRRPWKPSP